MHVFSLLLDAFNILYAVGKKAPLGKKSAPLTAAVSGKHMWACSHVLL